jgi:hypothetical protein
MVCCFSRSIIFRPRPFLARNTSGSKTGFLRWTTVFTSLSYAHGQHRNCPIPHSSDLERFDTESARPIAFGLDFTSAQNQTFHDSTATLQHCMAVWGIPPKQCEPLRPRSAYVRGLMLETARLASLIHWTVTLMVCLKMTPFMSFACTVTRRVPVASAMLVSREPPLFVSTGVPST